MSQQRPVLVVDDDPNIRELLADLLDGEGYAVSTAANGAEALDVVERDQPGLVLLDMRMPVLDGWGFARELAARGRQLPIVVMTAARDSAEWATEINAAGAIAKPFDLVGLLDLVEQHAAA